MMPSTNPPHSTSEAKSASSARLRQASPWNDRLRFESLPFPRKSAPGSGPAIDAFVREMPTAIDELEQACSKGDVPGIHQVAIRIRKLATLVGGLRVSSLAARLESTAAEGAKAECNHVIPELRRASAQFYRALLDEQIALADFPGARG